MEPEKSTLPRRQSQQQEPIIIYDTHEWNPELELEKAIVHGCQTVIIEPDELGKMACVWIGTGNILDKIAMTCNVAAITVSLLWSNRHYIYCSFATVGILSTALYGLVWQFDPFYKYKLQKDYKERNKLPLHLVASNRPVVLVKHGTFLKSFTRYSLTFSAVLSCTWTLHRLRRL